MTVFITNLKMGQKKKKKKLAFRKLILFKLWHREQKKKITLFERQKGRGGGIKKKFER